MRLAVLRRSARLCLAAAVLLIAMQAFASYRHTRYEPMRLEVTAPVAAASAAQINHDRVALPAEDSFFHHAAQVAWNHFTQLLWEPATGLAKATPFYDRVTPWDIGSVLASVYSAHKLGLISDAEYSEKMGKTLRTLERIPLYRKAVFHKKYSAKNARMIDRGDDVSSSGYGWSATDLGRILVWLHIVGENDAQFAGIAKRIGRRVRMNETTANGYMYGGLIGTRGKLWKFQEGRIGYEQYSAQGLAWFNANVASALDLNRNAQPVEVLGVPLLADKRGLDRLNSEPFVLAGMEFGWSPEMRELALNVLHAQEARYKKTGQITMVSEDALNVKPHYFYYYCVYCNGKSFVIDVAEPGKFLDEPRWVSTKAAFGWHALVANDYTRTVMTEIAKAQTENAWSSGIFEKTSEPTRTYDINTTAVVLEAALYRRLGRPLLFATRGEQ